MGRLRIDIHSLIPVICLILSMNLQIHANTDGRGTNDSNRKPDDIEIKRLMKEMAEWGIAASQERDRRAEETYTQKGAKIVWRNREPLAQYPENAALLYYRALRFLPTPDETVAKLINNVFGGDQPDARIRTYLGHCLESIRLAGVASQIPSCVWGRIEGDDYRAFKRMLSPLVEVIALDARTLAADGHYRAALDRCTTLQRMSIHVGSNTQLYSPGAYPSGIARATHILGIMPPDTSTLLWFRSQLVAVRGFSPSAIDTAEREYRRILNGLPKTLKNYEKLIKKAGTSARKQTRDAVADDRLQELTPKELRLVLEPYERYLDACYRIIDSNLSYEQTCAELKMLYDSTKARYGSDPIIAGCLTSWDRMSWNYNWQVWYQAGDNALKTALEIYLIKAETGDLPAVLPDRCPKDPFSGKDFQYDETEQGFRLSCRVRPINRSLKWQFDFKISDGKREQ